MDPNARQSILRAIEANEAVGKALADALRIASGEAVTVNRFGTWDIATLGLLWEISDGLPGARALLRTCAERPDVWVPFSDIADSAGIEHDQLRNEISRFHREQNDAGIKDRPYETKQVPELDYKTGYKMPGPIARLLTEAVAAS